MTSSRLRYVYVAWAVTALFYLYQYVLRTVPGVISQELREAFHMTAHQYSLFGAVYLYAYALLQIPVGKLLDRFGVKIVLTVSLLLCIIGALLLSVGESFGMALLSRILMGIGSAAPFTCAVKIVADGFPLSKRSIWTGAVLTLGTLGPIIAGKPLSMLIDCWSWREVVGGITVAGFVLLVVMWRLLPNHSTYMEEAEGHAHHEKAEASSMGSLWQTLKQPAILYYAIAAIGLYAPLTVMIDVWGTAFISEQYHLERGNAAAIAMVGYAGLAIGSILITWLSDVTGRLVRIIRICSILLLLCFLMLIFVHLSIPLLLLSFLFLGVLCGSEMLCFAGVSYYTTPRNSGFVLGCVNTLNMLGGGLLNQCIGTAMDWQWSGAVSETGVRIYQAAEYSHALLVLLPILLLSVVVAYKLPDVRKAHA